MRLGARVVAGMAARPVLPQTECSQDVRRVAAKPQEGSDAIAGRRGLPPRQKYAVAPGDPVSQLLQTRRAGTLKARSEEHTSELQSQSNLVCRLLLEKK